MTPFRTLTLLVLLSPLALPTAFAGPPGMEGGQPPHAERDGPPPHVIDRVRERESEILAWVETNDPDSHRKLTQLRRADPRAYLGHLVRVSRMMDRANRDPEMVERHREMRRLERKVQELVDGYPALEGKEKKDRRKQIDEAVGRLFEMRQAERRVQLEEMRQRIAELQGEIEERDRDQAAIIEDYVDQLLRDPVDL